MNKKGNKTKKKGFTLVELMAVIVIIGVITLIAIVSMRGIQRGSELKMIESNFDLMLAAGSTYGEDHFSTLTTTQSMYISTLKTYTELELDSSYDDLTILVYPKNNKAYSCIVKNSKKLHNISLTDEEIKSFEKYFCKESAGPSDPNPPVIIPPNNGDTPSNSGTSATFKKGTEVNAIIKTIMNSISPNDDGGYSISYCASDESCHYTADNSGVQKYNISSTTMSIYLYGVEEGYIYMSSDAETLFLNPDSSSMFKDLNKLVGISFLEEVNTKKVTNMSYMFYNAGITSVGSLANWDVSKVTTMFGMFYHCVDLESLEGLNEWKTSSLTDMCSMFEFDSKITSLSPLANWNVSKVVDINGTFDRMTNVTSLEGIRNWKLGSDSSVSYVNIGAAFKGLSKVTTLEPISNWPNTEKYISLSSYSETRNDYSGAFQDMTALTQDGVNHISKWKLIARDINTSQYPRSCYNGKNAQYMYLFKGTKKPTSLSVYSRDLNHPLTMGSGYTINANGTIVFTNDTYCH